MRKLFLFTLLLASPASAQQQTTPIEQALSAKLIQEIQSGLNCSSNSVTLHAELAKANAEIKSLKEKYEPKPEENKKP